MINKMEKEQVFDAKAKKGNEIFKNICETQKWCQVNKFSQNKFARWDVSYKTKGIKVIAEIKVRNQIYTDYVLELDKLEGLRQTKKQMGDDKIRLHYINILPQNRTYVWDITDLKLEEYEIKRMLLQKNDYDDEKVWKDVIMLCNTTAEKHMTVEEKLTVYQQNNEEIDDLPF